MVSWRFKSTRRSRTIFSPFSSETTPCCWRKRLSSSSERWSFSFSSAFFSSKKSRASLVSSTRDSKFKRINLAACSFASCWDSFGSGVLNWTSTKRVPLSACTLRKLRYWPVYLDSGGTAMFCLTLELCALLEACVLLIFALSGGGVSKKLAT